MANYYKAVLLYKTVSAVTIRIGITMNTILCTTSSFGVFATHVFDILKEKGFQTITNPF